MQHMHYLIDRKASESDAKQTVSVATGLKEFSFYYTGSEQPLSSWTSNRKRSRVIRETFRSLVQAKSDIEASRGPRGLS